MIAVELIETSVVTNLIANCAITLADNIELLFLGKLFAGGAMENHSTLAIAMMQSRFAADEPFAWS